MLNESEGHASPRGEPDTAEPLLLRHEDGGVVTLTLNRPRAYNALSQALLAALQAEFDRLAVDPDVRCVVLAASGKAFSAGHDLREMRAHEDEATHRALFARCSALMQAIRACPVPVIAAVQGIATAAGCQLVATCDLAMAAESARFAVSGINLGLFCSTPAVALTRVVPPKAAFDMLMTGRFVDAAEAIRIGLVNRVVPDGELAKAVVTYAAEIASKSPTAVRLGKRLVYGQGAMGLADAYRYAGDAMACNMMEPDAKAGIDGFLDRSTDRRETPS